MAYLTLSIPPAALSPLRSTRSPSSFHLEREVVVDEMALQYPFPREQPGHGYSPLVSITPNW